MALIDISVTLADKVILIAFDEENQAVCVAGFSSCQMAWAAWPGICAFYQLKNGRYHTYIL